MEGGYWGGSVVDIGGGRGGIIGGCGCGSSSSFIVTFYVRNIFDLFQEDSL